MHLFQASWSPPPPSCLASWSWRATWARLWPWTNSWPRWTAGGSTRSPTTTFSATRVTGASSEKHWLHGGGLNFICYFWAFVFELYHFCINTRFPSFSKALASSASLLCLLCLTFSSALHPACKEWVRIVFLIFWCLNKFSFFSRSALQWRCTNVFQCTWGE